MTEQQYRQILGFLRANPRREKIAAAVTRHLPKLFFAVYAAELAILAVQLFLDGLAPEEMRTLFGAILMPALCLLTTSLLRKKLNHPRPYEALPITPLIHKETRGHSFPSNHTASAFVLAMTAFQLSCPLGVIMLLMAALTGLSRVAAGLHWPKDVLCGMGIGITLGVLQLMIF